MRRGLLVALTVGASAFGVSSIATAEPVATATKATTKLVYIKQAGSKLFFDEPSRIRVGQRLKIVNQTDPSAVGPHTFSLVRGSLIPRQGEGCSICGEIEQWHANGNVSKAGRKGWDTEGTRSKRGDSWFTSAQGSSFAQKVTAEPGRLTFMCRIHSFMKGSIKVKR